MKLAALILLVAIIGKISAVPVPYRLAYYRAAPQQNEIEEEESEEATVADEASEEDADFTEDLQDDDDDDDEQEKPPEFSKLFPLPQANSPGYNYPLTSMMGEIAVQGWNVPKKNPGQRARNELARDDDDDSEEEEDDDDEDEEDDDAEDDLPDWDALFPNVESQGNGPPSDVVDSSSQPEIGQFRSGLGGGSRVVYVPASQLRGLQGYGQGPVYRRPSASPRQYIVRQPSPPRAPVAYSIVAPSSYSHHRQPIMRSPSPYMRQQQSYRRPQQYYSYMPVRRNYSPYVSMPVRRNVVPRFVRY